MMRHQPGVLRALVLGLTVVVLGVPLTVSAGTPVYGPIVISADSEREVYPSVAYNSQRQEYLVVWHNDLAGCDDIRAQRLRKDGVLLGPAFYISAGCPADRHYPDVTYDTAHDQYLVAWEQYDASNGYSIQARRVSGTGQVLDTTDIAVRGPGYNLYTPVRPAVAYAYTSDRYLVVWAETWHPTPITYQILGQVITNGGALEGSSFTISQGSDSREEPDVAYNRHANRYLVVWQQKAGVPWDIHGQQVNGGGGLYQGDITIAYYTTASTAPAVAAIPTTPTSAKFLVVWELLYAPNDHDIYGRLVAEDGTASTDFWISWAGGVDETSPAVAGSEDNLQYLVVWRHPQGVVDKPIKGQAISYGGTLQGQTATFPGPAADHPAVAAGPLGDLLVAWQDQPVSATNEHLYGRLWGNRTYLPLTLRNQR